MTQFILEFQTKHGIVVKWFNWFRKPKGFYPKDVKKYIVDVQVIEFTERVLREYGNKKPSCEGLIYWAGHVQNNIHYITHAIAPKTQASRYGIQTSHNSNALVVEYLCDNDLVYISQVHTHPGKWVDHSDVDNEETAFRSEGFLSVVVPLFSKNGILPWEQCGVHLYHGSEFKRLANRYLSKRFSVKKINQNKVEFKDFRYERDLV
ncbi:hypothetical protein [Pedobacter boryungensis]|uniref:JAB domain-containing protein n=1 Tax=Pedobacter boryungensis TaxID=869962 RepID=A0ABX2DCV6_9SPHI|nr:hypothetical protein [Pedobacter boryungensis]NQX31642.1 hypothetical protein [Pedobacter boryungensis]